MTRDNDQGGTTLLEPSTAETPAPQRSAPPQPRTRLLWPLAGLIVAALAVLGVWTFTATRTVDELVDTASVSSTHDSVIAQHVRARDDVAEAAASQHDSIISAQIRNRAENTEACPPPAPGAGGWENRLGRDC